MPRRLSQLFRSLISSETDSSPPPAPRYGHFSQAVRSARDASLQRQSAAHPPPLLTRSYSSKSTEAIQSLSQVDFLLKAMEDEFESLQSRKDAAMQQTTQVASQLAALVRDLQNERIAFVPGDPFLGEPRDLSRRAWTLQLHIQELLDECQGTKN